MHGILLMDDQTPIIVTRALMGLSWSLVTLAGTAGDRLIGVPSIYKKNERLYCRIYIAYKDIATLQ